MKKLLIFDLNGVLCHKVQKNEGNVETENIKYDFVLDENSVKFLLEIKKYFDIGIWTSTNERNAKKIVSILNDTYNIYFKMVWYRDRTQLNPDFGKDDSIKEFDTIKDIRQVLTNSFINYKRLYNEDNVIIIDDDENKVKMNKNYFIVCKKSNRVNYIHLYNKIMKKYAPEYFSNDLI